MDQESKKIAAGLFALGVKKGDRVAIWGPNQSEWYIIKVNYAFEQGFRKISV